MRALKDREEGESDSRRFIRHSAVLPLHSHREGDPAKPPGELRNISYGGIAFVSSEPYKPGDVIEVDFPALRRRKGSKGEVVWSCLLDSEHPSRYMNAMKFVEENTHFQVRLIEQVCHIEGYRRAEQQRGRKLSPQEAADECLEQRRDRSAK
jgi:hypothetical protein